MLDSFSAPKVLPYAECANVRQLAACSAPCEMLL